MSLLVPINGQNYIIPETNEVGWGSNLDDFFVAISAGTLQKTGGSFTLSAETDFGSSYGLKSLYYKSRSSNIAASGILRLNNNSDAISWRNFLNNADLALLVNASNQLTFNGTPVQPNTLTSAHILVGNSSNIATDVAMTGDISIDNTGLTAIGAGKIVNAQVNASAAIAYSKLNLTGSIVNADVNASAAIAYSKLTLTNSILNADVNSAAAIAYSKLALTGSIVNADINASAAIAYSKLALTGSIVNADVNASAAIAYSKLNLALSVVNADVSTSAAIAYSKLNLTGSILNADVNASAAIAYSKLNLSASVVNADISSSAAIAITKIANGTANQVLGTNAGASANEWKTLTATANQVSVTHGVGTVTFATPQDIGTASAVRFGSLTLGGALDASSILSLISTTKGFLPPVMTTTQRTAISTPTDGLIVYDSSLAQLFLRAGAAWTPLSVGGGSGTVGSGTQYQLGYYAAGGTTISGLTLITGSRALASDANGLPVASATTAAELAFVNGVTSAIQTQMDLKAPKASPVFTGVISNAVGAVGTPSYTFTGDLDTGIYHIGANNVGLAANGALIAEWDGTNFYIDGSQLINGSGTAANPAYSFGGDANTGMWRIGADDLGLVTGGTTWLEIDSSGSIILSRTGLAMSSSVSNNAGQVKWRIKNTSNTASSDALMEVQTGGLSSGDAYYYVGNGSQEWSAGLDTSASKFVIAHSSALGTVADALTIDTSLNVNVVTKTGLQVGGVQTYPIAQVVSATTTTVTTTTSTTLVDTSLTATITPKFNTSKILVFVSCPLVSSSAAGNDTIATIIRASTDLTSAIADVFGGTGGKQSGCAAVYYDSPATTSATTYKVQIKGGGGSTAQWGATGDTQSIVLVEIVQ